jgi:hypothetical protein
MPVKVRVAELAPDAVFRTTLTRRVGVVLSEPEYDGIPVYLDPIKGDLFEEKVLAPQVVVEIDPTPYAAAVHVAAIGRAA